MADGTIDELARCGVSNAMDSSSVVRGNVVVNVATDECSVSDVVNGASVLGLVVKKITVNELNVNAIE